MAQPQVSKHLREVGLVKAREEGRMRLYRLDGRPLHDIHRWVSKYEQMWNERFERLDEVLEQLRKEERDGGGDE